MIFDKHDFRSNFDGISKSKDIELSKDMMISEIAYLIANQRNDFLDMLKQTGYDVKSNVSDVELADIVIDNIAKDKKLATGIAYLIVNRHENLSNAEGSSDNGCTGWQKFWGSNGCKKAKETTPLNKGEEKTTTTSNASGLISSITNLTGTIFAYATEKEKSAAQKESDKMQLMQYLIANRSAQEQPAKSNTALYVVGGVLLLAAIGVAIYFGTRKKPVAVAAQ